MIFNWLVILGSRQRLYRLWSRLEAVFMFHHNMLRHGDKCHFYHPGTNIFKPQENSRLVNFLTNTIAGLAVWFLAWYGGSTWPVMWSHISSQKSGIIIRTLGRCFFLPPFFNQFGWLSFLRREKWSPWNYPIIQSSTQFHIFGPPKNTSWSCLQTSPRKKHGARWKSMSFSGQMQWLLGESEGFGDEFLWKPHLERDDD